MPTLVAVVDSANPKKRYTAIFDVDGRQKKVNFGDPNMESYVMHHDKERRENYRRRHARDLRTNDPLRSGFLSMFLLWGPSRSLEKNIATYKRKFNL
jgi:hypothetical protein